MAPFPGAPMPHLLLLLVLTACTHDETGGPALDLAPGDTGDTSPVDSGPGDTALPPDPWALDLDRVLADIEVLASPAYEGRAAGTPGNALATALVESRFEELGLAPAGDDNTFRQTFTFPRWEVLTPAQATFDGEALAEGPDFAVFSDSGSATVESEVVFAGYGLVVPPFDPAAFPRCPLSPDGFDEYQGVDVTGRIVLVLRHVPSDDSDIQDRCPSTDGAAGDLATFTRKAWNAADNGALGLILVNDWRHEPEPGSGSMGGSPSDLAAIWMHRDRAVDALPDLESWARTLDETLTPASRATGVQARLDVSTAVQDVEVSNVLGAVTGASPTLGAEVVVLGAHLDHMGVDGAGNLYAGADDNASGTAVMMELARALVESGATPARTVLFAAWNAEEVGLLGSSYYVGVDPTFPLESTMAAWSVDMVGVGDGSGVWVFGGNTAPNLWLHALMANASAEAGLPYSVVAGDPLYASDHAPFAMAGIPAALAYTLGDHPTYHTPEDTFEGISRDALSSALLPLWAMLEPLVEGREDAYLAPPAAVRPPGPAPTLERAPWVR